LIAPWLFRSPAGANVGNALSLFGRIQDQHRPICDIGQYFHVAVAKPIAGSIEQGHIETPATLPATIG
jgi:hypothetical protein